MKIYDYSKLLELIKEKGYTQKELAVQIPLSPTTFNIKLNNKGDFTQREMLSICSILSIPIGEIPDYFFCPNTLENQSIDLNIEPEQNIQRYQSQLISVHAGKCIVQGTEDQ